MMAVRAQTLMEAADARSTGSTSPNRHSASTVTWREAPHASRELARVQVGLGAASPIT